MATTTVNRDEQATGNVKFRLDDRTVLEAQNLVDFNSYRNWGYFPGAMDPTWKKNAKDNKQVDLEYPDFTVTKSLFNNVNAIGANTNYQKRANAFLIDTPLTRKLMKEDDDCSVRALVKNTEAEIMGRQIYRYADFMYCKYLGRIPNNYMVTLRRFPYPCGDQIGFLSMGTDDNENKLQQHMPDIGRMVTWMGAPGNDLNNILKYKIKMPFKKMDAKIEDTGDAGGDSGGLLGTLMNMGGNSSYQQGVLSGTSGSSVMSGINKMTGLSLGNPSYEGKLTHHDQNKPWGPVDTIKSTHIRGEDGLRFENQFNLTFEYELRSYDGVNGKASFLDLIANVLTVTYSTGKFWGGGYRGTGTSQHNMFANLPIYKIKNGASLSEIMGSVTDSLSEVGKAMSGNKELSGNFLADAKSIISNMGKQFAQALFAGALNKLGRPMKHAVNSLLSPTPVGFWHVTVGNPMHPIVQMGNMIIDNCEINLQGPLGLDDFPTSLKVVVTLKHAKMRDQSLFEQMFQYGDMRIYSPVDDDVKRMYENSSRINQKSKYGANMAEQFKYIVDRNRAENDTFQTTDTEGKSSTDANMTKESTFMNDAKSNAAKDKKNNKKTGNKGADSASATPPEEDPGLTEVEMAEGEMKKLYTKHFGTHNLKNITWAGQEGADGSSPPQTKEDDTKKTKKS